MRHKHSLRRMDENKNEWSIVTVGYAKLLLYIALMTYGPVYIERNFPEYFRGLLRQTFTFIKKNVPDLQIKLQGRTINFYFKIIFDIPSFSPSKSGLVS